MIKIRRKRGFTLIELIAVLVIMAILALIVTPLVMNIIRKAKTSTRKRSVDAYGRSVELAIASYLMDTGTFPTNEQLPNLQVEYSGSTVVCNVMAMKENGGLYLSECKVNDVDVKDSKTEDGWYHYGTRDLTDTEYVDMYGDALKTASLAYFNTNGNPVEDYRTLTLDYKGKPVSCEVTVNYDGTIYMTKCKVNNVEVTSDTEDGYYHYGSIVTPMTVSDLIAKANPVTVTNYTDGNTKEMYTFEHSATEQTPALTDYRYIGANPNNYVYFNGDELWRIIGVFTVEDGNGNTEQRIKIVRNEKLSTDMAWDTNNVNEWSTASLNTYLNGDYYNGIEATSKSMIADTKYYLGGRKYDSTTHFGTTPEIYAWERGTTIYNKYGAVRSTLWNGKIALMYPSDYAYTYALGVDNTCYNDEYKCRTGGTPTNGWIYNTNSDFYQWLLSPYPDDPNKAFELWSFVSESRVISAYGIHPTLYLSSQVKITDGEGTEQNPYRLSM